jgi:4-amino-4-deoxy-L-arabinose transferase-like glycosyltransferase
MTRLISGASPERSTYEPTPPHDVGAQSSSRVAVRKHWFELLLLTLALAVWFGYELGTRELWSPDEGRYAEIPREMLATGDFVTPRLNGVKYFEKPPLMYWLEAGAIKAFGLNEWALRLWPAVFALVGCLAVYFVANALYGRPVGLLAAGVLATSPLYDFMGGILTLDMPLTGELTVALCAFLAAIRAPPGAARRLLFYVFYAFIAFAVLTKGLVGLAIPAMVIGAWVIVLNRWRLLREMHLPTGALLFLAIAVPWHVLVARANPEFAWFYFVHEHLERYLTTVHERYEPAWFFVPVLLVGMYPWTAFLPYALRDATRALWRRRAECDDVWFLLLWAGLPFVFFSFSDSKLIPYVLPVWPPLAMLLGRWLTRVYRGQASPGRAAPIALLLLGALLGVGLALAPQLLPDRPHVVSIAAQLGVGLYVMAGGLLLAGLLPFVCWRKRNRRLLVMAMFAAAALLIAAFDLNLSRLDVGRSVKDLALVLKARLRPGDEVMTYEVYYQDLPVYLQRRITVVNWKGELEFGTTVEDTHEWIIDTPTFRARWNAPGTVYLLTSHSSYEKLRAHPPGPMHLIAQTQHAVLVVNREGSP